MVNWFIKNIKKITFALALTGAVTGSIGLILVSSIRSNELSYYLDKDYTAVWGKGTIWVNNFNGFHLYFGSKPKYSVDYKWDGKYPKRYFYD